MAKRVVINRINTTSQTENMDISVSNQTTSYFERYKNEFQETSRTQVHDFLDDKSAVSLLEFLKCRVDWKIAISDEKSSPLFLDKYSGIHDRVIEKARKRSIEMFQYWYECLPIYGEHIKTLDSETKEIYDFINSNCFLDLASKITQRDDLVRCDGHLAKYSKGHFLGRHYDTSRDGEIGTRRVAFTIGMTETWADDWGGHTLFLSGEKCFFSPIFNSLTLFSVPQPHLVSQISKYVDHSRYTVAGWFHSN